MKGIYVLVIKVNKDVNVNIGALGIIRFVKGVYVYVGSAQNSLEKRIKRHLRKTKRKFWHIDYLLDDRSVEVVDVFYKKARKLEECKTARALNEVCAPIVNFGCSDCNCASHLLTLHDADYSRSSMDFLMANFNRSV